MTVLDAPNNLTDRNTRTWSLDQIGFTKSYTNNRNSDDTYDEAGNVIASSTSGGGESLGGGWYNDNKGWDYDASGRMAKWLESGPWGTETIRGGQSTFDGDDHGHRVYMGGTVVKCRHARRGDDLGLTFCSPSERRALSCAVPKTPVVKPTAVSSGGVRHAILLAARPQREIDIMDEYQIF